MKRSVKKQFWFTREEAKDLQKKAKKTCLTEAGLVRVLLAGYEPKEKPDDRFYHVMSQMSDMSKRMEHLEQVLKVKGLDGEVLVKKEVERWNKFQLKVEQAFLSPEIDEEKWQ